MVALRARPYIFARGRTENAASTAALPSTFTPPLPSSPPAPPFKPWVHPAFLQAIIVVLLIGCAGMLLANAVLFALRDKAFLNKLARRRAKSVHKPAVLHASAAVQLPAFIFAPVSPRTSRRFWTGCCALPSDDLRRSIEGFCVHTDKKWRGKTAMRGRARAFPWTRSFGCARRTSSWAAAAARRSRRPPHQRREGADSVCRPAPLRRVSSFSRAASTHTTSPKGQSATAGSSRRLRAPRSTPGSSSGSL